MKYSVSNGSGYPARALSMSGKATRIATLSWLTPIVATSRITRGAREEPSHDGEFDDRPVHDTGEQGDGEGDPVGNAELDGEQDEQDEPMRPIAPIAKLITLLDR